MLPIDLDRAHEIAIFGQGNGNGGPGSTEIDQGTPVPLTLAVGNLRLKVDDMDNGFTSRDPRADRAGPRRLRVRAEELGHIPDTPRVAAAWKPCPRNCLESRTLLTGAATDGGTLVCSRASCPWQCIPVITSFLNPESAQSCGGTAFMPPFRPLPYTLGSEDGGQPPLNCTFLAISQERHSLTYLRRLDLIRLFAFSVLLLAPSVISWAQQRPAIAEKMAKTHGLDSFGQVEGIRYTFNVARPDGNNVARGWEWNPKTDAVSYEGKDKDGKPVKVTYRRSQPGMPEDIDATFLNDQYWLLLPFHVIWNTSATVTEECMQKLPLGNGSGEKLVVKYLFQGAFA